MDTPFKPQLTVFHCINSFNEDAEGPPDLEREADVKFIEMSCSSMVKDVFLLRAFEAGADAVVVLVCPVGRCRHMEGNTRAHKRVAWVKDLLDEIGLDGGRLSIYNIAANEPTAVAGILKDTLSGLAQLGPNPAR